MTVTTPAARLRPRTLAANRACSGRAIIAIQLAKSSGAHNGKKASSAPTLKSTRDQ
jgi:hypothetical protein